MAVLLVDATGQRGGIRSAPISSLSPKLHEQGILDAMVSALESRFASGEKPSIEELTEMRRNLQRSVYLTEPRPVAIGDVDLTLNALYRAYAAPRGGGSAALTKGKVLDGVVSAIRRRGLSIRRGQYVGDFLFDFVADRDVMAGHVLSFASGARTAQPAEKEAGHFLYGIGRLGIPGVAVIEPPPNEAPEPIQQSHERVQDWMLHEHVEVVRPELLRGVTPLRGVFEILVSASAGTQSPG